MPYAINLCNFKTFGDHIKIIKKSNFLAKKNLGALIAFLEYFIDAVYSYEEIKIRLKSIRDKDKFIGIVR